MCPQGKTQGDYPCIPGLCLHSVLTQLVTKHFNLRHIILFGVSKHCIFCSVLLLPREKGGSQLRSATCWTPAGRAVTGSCPGSRFMATPSWKPTPGLLIAASFPALMLGNSAALRQPHSFHDPTHAETTLFHLEFYPAFHLSALQALQRMSLSGADFWKFWFLCSTVLLLSNSWFTEAPSLCSLFFPYITMDSLPSTSYLAENGAFLFVELQLFFP